MPNKQLDVYYHGKNVGTLAQTSDKRVAFQYSTDWQKTGFSISPFSLPLRNDVFIPSVTTREYLHGLFGVFADSLPDSWGNLLLDRFLLSIGVKPDEINELDRLAYIGKSGMGALEYYPSKESEYRIETVALNYDEIARECAKILESKESDKLDMIYNIAGSSGGTRPKIFVKEKNEEWIVKFASHIDSPSAGKKEYEYYKCATKCGINMSDSELIKSKKNEGYFMTKRFDRVQGEKILFVSFAGMLEADYRAPCLDYLTCMKLVQALTKNNINDLKQLYKTMCFNVFAHNMDDHAKNFAFIYTDAGGWRLSPMFDLTYSSTYYGEHTTSVNGKGKNITDSDLITVGVKAGLSKQYVESEIQDIKGKTAYLKDLSL